MPTEMRVALDLSSTQRPRLTGWERFARSLHDALTRRGDVDVAPLLLPRPSRGRLSTLVGQLWWYWRGCSSAIRRTRPRLLHAPTFPPGRVDVPVVWTVHDTLILGAHPEFARSGSDLWAPLARRALLRAEAVVTGTQSVADELREMGVSEDRLSVVSPGTTELPEIGTRPAHVRRLTDGAYVPAPSEYLLMVGTLEPRKRPDVAVRVAERLQLPLVLAGRRDPSLDLSRLGPWEHGYHASELDDHGLAWLYDNAIAVLAPSEYEGFDLPVTEALARGTRVVASRTPVHLEVGGERCTYFEVNEIDDASLAVSAAMQTPPPVATGLPTWDGTAAAYTAIYRRFIGEPGRGDQWVSER